MIKLNLLKEPKPETRLPMLMENLKKMAADVKYSFDSPQCMKFFKEYYYTEPENAKYYQLRKKRNMKIIGLRTGGNRCE